MGIRVCAVANCEKSHLAKGYCANHYARWRRTGDPLPIVRSTEDLCSECGLRYSKYRNPDRCEACYRRWRRGDVDHRPGICRNPLCGKSYISRGRYSKESGRGLFCSRACKQKMRTLDGRSAASARKHNLKRLYGLTVEQADALQQGVCSICGGHGIEGRWGNLHFDHDHQTGAFRGALCHNCNLGIGQFKDDPTLLDAAAAYLRRHALT